MSLLGDRRLLVKIAQMYYEEGATQSEIAQAIGVSRPLISKYLAKARELGVVEIIIHDHDTHPFTGLESKVEKRYGLREVVCVESNENDASKARMGQAASHYLLRMIRDGQTIGMSSGTTLYEVAMALSSSQHFPNVQFIPLVGGMGHERVDIHANQIVAKLADVLKAKCKLLHAPVLVDSKEAKEIIVNQSSIREIFEIGAKADIAMVGIGGTPEHSTMVKSYLQQTKGVIEYENIVGDICYNFIGEDGCTIDNDWNARVISMDLDHVKQIPLVIGVASGKEKVKAIKAALRAKLIHVLITDDLTARMLLDH
ncbi:sugar-binding transcriptional regulator [Shouchella clausii]|uniref:Transcriptional regulator n=2 Tax=Bacillaceae TaxID=186817 RepID=Q5WCZ3_SHOC1|nr:MULTISPECIES: sugar-binding transcriptional regulator [Shouchella]MCM3313032.1 sugar-binding transcriptional regulator [Psychrobacillus sp. MER TA 17]ALA53874.1 Sorbitol operon transcription regulator [Shouchella clausii]KKI86999.1 transcriptional regulator [Shouchella clausii]MBU3229565.1 sugar-binding transcriptional regulator [Shouchella clausii]MBU3265212.1 sugar-binding transcriptional regulator [Shouchella clausii]